MTGKYELNEAFELMALGANAQNRKELDEQFQKRITQIFGIELDIPSSEWDYDKKYKLIISFGSRDQYLRKVRQQMPAVFNLIEEFLHARKKFEVAGLDQYANLAGENIDVLLNEIFMRVYPYYSENTEIDLNKARSENQSKKVSSPFD